MLAIEGAVALPAEELLVLVPIEDRRGGGIGIVDELSPSGVPIPFPRLLVLLVRLLW